MTTTPAATVQVNEWLPTKKWVAGLVTGLASIAATWIATGAFDAEEKAQAATLLVALAGLYFRRNDATIEGKVPETP